MGFAKWMASPIGRWLRVVAGIALIGAAIYVQGGWGVALGVVGAVPLLAGIFNVCLFAPLFGAPFNGTRLRAQA